MGGTLQFSSVRKNLRYLVPTLTVKLVLVPAIIVAVSVLLGFSPLERFVLYSQFAAPVEKVYGAIKSLGFLEVVEVAQGAMETTRHEAEELKEKLAEGQRL